MSEMIPRRDSDSEYIGRQGHRQVDGWLDAHGFIPSRIEPDKGEDVLVRAYRDGVWTGISFYIQVKSTDDIDSYRLADGQVSYPIETKALRHWRASKAPVFLIVWDINQRSGYWVEVSRGSTAVDLKDDGSWLEQGTINIRLPLENRTDEAGAKAIYECLLRHFGPLWQKEPVTIWLKCQFPTTTPEGREAQERMLRWHERGDPVEISGKFITEFKVSENMERLFGPVEFNDQGVVMIGPQLSKREVEVQLQVFSPQGRQRATLRTSLKVVKKGEKEMTLANGHAPTPLSCRLVFGQHAEGIRFNVDISTEGVRTNVRDARGAVPFLQALSKAGSLKITVLSGDNPLTFETSIAEGGFPDFGGDYEMWLSWLCFIQEQTGQPIEMTSYILTPGDVRDISELHQILSTGTVTEAAPAATITLGEPTSEDAAAILVDVVLRHNEESEVHQMTAASSESSTTVLGQEFALGPMRQHIEGRVSSETLQRLRELRADPEKLKALDSLPLALEDYRSVSEFPRWQPE